MNTVVEYKDGTKFVFMGFSGGWAYLHEYPKGKIFCVKSGLFKRDYQVLGKVK